MSNELSKIVRDLTALRKQVHGLSTTSQINHSSLDNSTIVAYDADGHERLRIGRQDDGTHAIKHVQGPPPPQPSAPTVTVDGVVITVEHDGTNVGDAPLPADYRRRIVYAGVASDMSDAVPVATIEPPAGGQAVFMSPGDGTVYVAVKNETFSAALSAHSHAVPVEVTMVSLEGELEIIKDSANGKNKNYYSPTAPESGDEGDVWFDTSIDPETGQPKWGLNLWDGSEWVSARDSRLQVVETAQAELAKKLDAVVVSADEGNKNFYSTTAPTKDMKAGDLWFDGSKSNVPHRWDGSKWVSVADERVAAVQKAQEGLKQDLSLVKATADGKNQSYYQSTKPTGSFTKGDLWFDTSTQGKNRVSVWDGKTWVDASDKRVADVASAQEALSSDLAGVRASVDGKTSVRWEASVPTSATPGGVVGDTWHQYRGGAHVGTWRWDGKKWVQQSLDPVMIPKLAIGTGTFGELDGARIKANTVVADKVLVKGSVGSTLITDGAVTTEKIATGAITAESGVIGSLDLGKATVGELDGARIKAGTVTVDQLLSGSPSNVLPGVDNLSVSAPGWSSFGLNKSDPSLWLKGRTTVMSDAVFELSAGATYTASTDVKSTVNDTQWLWQLMGQDGQPSPYIFSYETAGTEWRTVTGQFTVKQSGRYKLRVWANHTKGASNKDGCQWWRNMRISPAVDATLIKDGSVTTNKIATGAITAESGVVGSLDAGKITVGELDGARIKAGTVAADKVLIGSGGNLIPNGDGLTTSNAGFTGIDHDVKEKALVMPSNGLRLSSATFRVEPGEYELSADIKGPAGSHVYVGVQDGVNRWAYGISNVTITGAWKTYTSTLVVDQARSEQPQVVRILPGYGDRLPGSEKTWIRHISLRKKVGSTVIADGAITTEKIATGAVTAESGVIGSLDAGKITVGELDGARIKANTIGTDLLKAGAVTSDILNATAIDGMTITGATLRTSAKFPRVELNSGGLTALNREGAPTFSVSSLTGDAKLVGVLESGLPGARRVVINDALWVNKPYLRKTGDLGYSDASGIRLGYDADPTMHGDISFAEIVTTDEVESEDGETVTEVEKVTPSLTIEGPGLSPKEKASIDMYQSGSLIMKHAGTLTLRPTVATGERLTMHKSGSLTLKSRGDAEMYINYNGFARLRSGNGASLELLNGITLQSKGKNSVYLRTGTGNAYITVGYESNERNLYSASEHRFLGGDIYYFNARTVSYNANLYLGTSGRISKGSASSRRYKLDIQDYDVPEELLDVPFRTWVDKAEAEEKGTTEGLPRLPGLIAEEVAEVDPTFVIYDDQGRPDALHGDRIGMATLTLLRRQRDRITDLESRLTHLEKETN